MNIKWLATGYSNLHSACRDSTPLTHSSLQYILQHPLWASCQISWLLQNMPNLSFGGGHWRISNKYQMAWHWIFKHEFSKTNQSWDLDWPHYPRHIWIDWGTITPWQPHLPLSPGTFGEYQTVIFKCHDFCENKPNFSFRRGHLVNIKRVSNGLVWYWILKSHDFCKTSQILVSDWSI